VLRAQASGAEVEPFLFAIYGNSNRVNIGHPATVGVALGVTHIMTKLGQFPTQIALQYLSP